MNETMELIKLDIQNALEIFTGGGLDAILNEVEAKVRSRRLDVSTVLGRDEIRSVAYQVARTKTALDAEGKALTETWRKNTALVNAERKRAVERLDALGEEIRKPLTDFENKEKTRVAKHEEVLRDITGLHAMIAAHPDMSLDLLVEHQHDLVQMLPEYQWEEFSLRAQQARSEAGKYIALRIEARKRFEVEREELERLRRAEAERVQRERDERLKAVAAEAARLQAEHKAKAEADAEAHRVIVAAETERKRVASVAAQAKADSDRVLQEAHAREARIEQDRVREEQAKIAAEKRAKDAEDTRIAAAKKAEADRLAAEAKAAADLRAAQEKAKRDADAAAQRERDKIEAERKAEESARMKREADKKLRAKVQAEIVEDLMECEVFLGESITGPEALEIANKIMAGKVRHVRVEY